MRIRLRRRPEPEYVQRSDGRWWAQFPITDLCFIAKLEAWSREQGRREFERLRARVEGGQRAGQQSLGPARESAFDPTGAHGTSRPMIGS
jgi:hypothetical protein